MINENSYQAKLIKKLNARFPGCIITKGQSAKVQGIPDLRVDLPGVPFYAMLEAKKNSSAHHQPNQDYYIDTYNSWGVFAAFVYPENEEEVLNGLAQAYEAARTARGS